MTREDNTRSKHRSGAGPRVSVSMIVRDEEQFLAGCLESIKDIADEIIVVDTGSTDRTIEIARTFGAAVSQIEWCDDYSSARNESLRRCTGDWVLYVDADERLAEEGRGEIESLTRDTSAIAFRCSIVGEEWLPKGKVNNIGLYPRLFRRIPEFRFKGRVHEQLFHSSLGHQYTVRPSGITILHLGYQQSVETTRRKCQRNIDLLGAQLQEEPSDPMARYQLGNTLGIVGRYEEALIELNKVLELASVPTHVSASTLNALASFSLLLDDPAGSLWYAADSARIAPNQVTSPRLQASAYLALGKPAEALASMLRIRDMQKDLLRKDKIDVSFDATIPSVELDYMCGRCHADLGDWGQAAECFYKAAANDIYYEDVLDRYLEADLRRSDRVASREDLRNLISRHGSDVSVIQHLLGFYSTRLDWEAFEIVAEYSRTHSVHNDDTSVLMIQTYLSRGEFEKGLAEVHRGETCRVSSMNFNRIAVQAALKARDFQLALAYLEKIASQAAIPAGDLPL
ncbi:MAG: glycosyltransferase [Ignavibacteriales bacterium]|nr:glycosyltransferase [Ignavibacteriales bacterium]